MEIALTVLAIGLVASLAVCIYFAIKAAKSSHQCQSLQEQAVQIEEELNATRIQRDSTREENASLKTDIAVNMEKLRGIEERQKELASIEIRFKDAFDSLATQAMRDSRNEFLLETEKKLKPLNDLIKDYNVSYQAIEASRKQEYGGLKSVTEMLKDQTSGLVTALKRPEIRGKWGEIQLRRIAELAGMTSRCDFFEQEQVNTDQGRLRPDMVVKLPNDRTIVIDAKTVLDAFLAAINSSDSTQRAAMLKQHVQQIDTQVKKLVEKSYSEQFDRAPDFVVLFLRVESSLYAAMEIDDGLIERALEKKVIIATPTMLIALLRAVEMGWRERQIAENAREIQKIGQDLHQRICTAMEHLQRMSKSLGTTVKNHNEFVSSIETRVLSSTRKFEELGVKSAKELPQDSLTIEIVPTESKSLPATPEGSP